MALMQNAALPYWEDLYNFSDPKKKDFFGINPSKNVNFCPPRISGYSSRRNLKVNANMRGYKKVETINGKKVNGIHVEGMPFLGQTNTDIIKDRSIEEPNHEYLLGRFVEDRFVYRQSFVIRSYEIGPDKTATMETLMNLLQETALNHVASSGLAGNGFGATREMSLRKLIWVVTRIHVQVDKYSSWGDVVEIDTWVDAAGKNGMRRDWIIRDYNTHKIITRATSTWVIMNRETRRLCKIPDEVKKEVQPFYLNRTSIATEDIDSEKIEKVTEESAEKIRTGLAPRWSDMDANQHVNNVKYIGWILESVPINVLEDYNLTRMTLEYRRECRQSNVLESLTSMKAKTAENRPNNTAKEDFECTHLLRMEDDNAEIVRARSVWLFKPNHTI
ncbi:palmitoyl-acyl carrier protein thioesterase, chloroplastic-like [Olea europaea var. sylvestris]|uniref:Acyl-[acyl-carrier-protein] hydrolase n=1 Tax=Olea europaea subsp. europaea TaxID=158383 RepID=A0A8S0RAT9_OLEEU|nr:palmitoyl-acyl carrier protein thioesterase, chloroplastic-like [Olea europaea var. sylvestris]CAA2976379.1 palmitoyl-acyl carrier thioesterase, chloroplastic-like [Olea europaea subsp. europaea]